MSASSSFLSPLLSSSSSSPLVAHSSHYTPTSQSGLSSLATPSLTSLLHQKLTTNPINDTTTTTNTLEAAVASAVNRYLTASIKNNHQKMTSQRQQQLQLNNDENIISIDGKSRLLNTV